MSPLEPSADAQIEILQSVSELAVAHAQAIRDIPVTPLVDVDEVRERLAQIDFETPMGHRKAIEWCTDILRDTAVHTTSPRYFGLFNPTPSFMGIVGDLLAAVFNPQLGAWSHAPGPVEMEAELIRYFGRMLGISEETGGAFTSGGTEANAMALQLALTRSYPQFGTKGLREVAASPIVYTSTESHHSWLKIAHACGIGREAVRQIRVTQDLAIDVPALHKVLADDQRSGFKPVLVVATAGTTTAGVIDPLTDVAEAARATGAFLHVDAAWGGAAALSDRLRAHLDGIQAADSVTIDPHKWLSVPMGAGMLITRHQELLRETYRVSTQYMPDSVEGTVDPYTASNQWSRRFIGLKLFLTMLGVGRQGYAQQLETDAQLGDYLRESLSRAGWEVVNKTPLPVVCFRDPARPTDERYHREIVDRIVRSGKGWISTTSLAGLPAIRACITSYRTTMGDVDWLVGALDEARPLGPDDSP